MNGNLSSNSEYPAVEASPRELPALENGRFFTNLSIAGGSTFRERLWRTLQASVSAWCVRTLRKPSAQDLIRTSLSYLDDCSRKQSVPHAGELATLLNLSTWALTRAFQRELGIRPGAYLKLCQIDRARLLLTRTSCPNNVVAYGAPFKTRGAFYKAFRRATGMTPSEFRMSVKKAFDRFQE